jgi:Family of unknown function (DUF6982)
MLQQKVVARYKDGRVVKGYTNDFVPTKTFFHLRVVDSTDPKPVQVQVSDLKAVFFVKDFAGTGHQDKKEFDDVKPIMGRKLRVQFKDGEVLVGTTQGYQEGRPVFFLVPADPESNIERCMVVAAATKEILLL